MLIFLVSLAPLAASSHLKAVPYGRVSSAETLFPLPTPSTALTIVGEGRAFNSIVPDLPYNNGRRSDDGDNKHTVLWRLKPEMDRTLGSVVIRQADESEISSSEGSDSEDDDSPVHSGDDQDVSEFLPDPDDTDSEPLSNEKAGKFIMNCAQYPEACKNACYYHNCVKGVKGDVLKEYRVGVRNQQTEQRKISGVEVDEGRPCSTGPFGQKFWDGYPGADGPAFKMETDEWPMASFLLDDEEADSISLRCIPRSHNGDAGLDWAAFLKGDQDYADGGSLSRHRRLEKGERLPAGARFQVQFDLSQADQRTKDFLDVCQGVQQGGWSAAMIDDKCHNDGRQFYLKHQRDPNPKLFRLYDHEYHAAYQLYGEDDETDDNGDVVYEKLIQQYHVTLTVRGDLHSDDHEVEAYVKRFKSAGANKDRSKGIYEELAHASPQTLGLNQDFDIQGDLKQNLNIKKTRDCNGFLFAFSYGDTSEDSHRLFGFNHRNKGHSAFAVTKDKGPGGSQSGWYCLKDEETEKYKGKDRLVTTLQCSFPGW